MRSLLHAMFLGLTGMGLLVSHATSVIAETREIRLTRGAGITITAADEHLAAIGIAGRIWTLNPADGAATQLSADDELAQRPALSPDGQWVAYEIRRDGFDQIMVRNVDGSEPRQVTFGQFDHRSPTWSPSGSPSGSPPDATPASAGESRRLTMSANRGGNFAAWEIDLETLDLRKLTPGGGEERDPVWNRDGTQLAYVTDTRRGTALYAISPGGKPRKLLEEPAQIRSPAWRPGGGLITYVRESKGERQLRMLLLSKPAITKPITQFEDVYPHPAAWLDRMTFLYTANGQIRHRQFGVRNAESVAFDARITVERSAWSQREPELDAAASRSVVGYNGISHATDGTYFVAALGDLWEVDADGRLRGQLTNDPYVDAMPALSPDERSLAFVSDRGGSLQIWRLDLESKRLRRVTRENGVALNPRWIDGGTGIEYATAAHAAAPLFTTKRVAIKGAKAVNDEPGAATNTNAANAPPVLPLTWQQYVPQGRWIIRAGRVFDGLGPGYLTEHEIVIEGDRIVAVRPWSNDAETDGEADVHVIDASSRTVIPGLIDMSIRQARLGDERLGRKYLGYGVTTIREAVTHPEEAIERRESWHSGRRIGPRLLLAGGPCSEASADIDAALEYDAVSIDVCHSDNEADRAAMIAAIHAAGVSARAGEPLPDILLGANEARLPSSYLKGAEHFAIVAGQLGTTVTSNLAPVGLPLLMSDGELSGSWQYRELFTNAEHRWYEGGWKLRDSDRRRRQKALRARTVVLAAAVGGGAHVVMGSDAPLVPPGLGLHAELRLLADAGLQPFEVLRMATLDAGRALGAQNQLGVIKPGAFADLVIVDGDPLRNVRDAAKVWATVAGGRPYTRREMSTRGLRPRSVGKLYN
jgi:Tol biopolymer transport system component